MFFVLEFVMSFYMNKRICIWMKHTNFHVWKGILSIVLIMHLVHWWGANSSNTTHGIIYCYISRWGSVGKQSAPRITTIGKEHRWIYSNWIWSWRKRISFKLWKNKVLHKITINLYWILRFGTNLLEEGGYDVNCVWAKWRMTNAPRWCNFLYLNKVPMLCKIGLPNCVLA